MSECFVVCPLGEEGTDIRRQSDQVFRHIIEPICKEKGYTAIRCDKIQNVDKIDQTIIEKLKSADLVIADLSTTNPNAFFELGYRSALSKPLIHIAKEGEILPFDVAGIRTIFYTLTDPDKLAECKKRLSETITAICMDTNSSLSNTADSKQTSSQTPYINTQILTHLLEIKDILYDLQASTKENNNKVVEQIIGAFTNQLQNTSTPQDRITEYALKEFLNDPQKMMDTFAKIPGFKFPNQP
jgi:hypothetical protein